MEKLNENSENQMMDIWFFVGIILATFGVILVLAGIYYVFNPNTELIFGYLNPNLWWGVIMIFSGIIFQLISYFKRKK